jgi:hypothetical protein
MPDTTDADLVEALDSVHRLVTCDPRDWRQDRHDAFLYGLFAGWDCTRDHVHDDECGKAADAIAERHGWDAAFVTRLRRLHDAVNRTMTGGSATP